jgi:hypothetical protein
MSDTNRYYDFLKSDRLEKILNYGFDQLEIDHEFIQWIFPTVVRSAFNTDAPIINIEELIANPNYHEACNLMRNRSLPLMLEHWGISQNITTVTSPRRFSLLNGHNGLRFSRVLQSLIFHGERDVADRLLDFVILRAEEFGIYVSRSNQSTSLWEDRFQSATSIMKGLRVVRNHDDLPNL